MFIFSRFAGFIFVRSSGTIKVRPLRRKYQKESERDPMKNRKFLALFLALAMVLALAVPAFAEDASIPTMSMAPSLAMPIWLR